MRGKNTQKTSTMVIYEYYILYCNLLSLYSNSPFTLYHNSLNGIFQRSKFFAANTLQHSLAFLF